MVEALLSMQLVRSTQCSMLLVSYAICHTPYARMSSCHGTHCTWLLDHIAVKASAQIRPAEDSTRAYAHRSIYITCIGHDYIQVVTGHLQTGYAMVAC